MHRFTPLVMLLALAGLAPPALADGAGARATPALHGHAAGLLEDGVQVQLGERVWVDAWPAVDQFESVDGTDRMVRVHAGVGLRYAREGFSFGAEARYRVADLGSAPGDEALDDHQMVARFGFDL